jgi:hypothetical protein
VTGAFDRMRADATQHATRRVDELERELRAMEDEAEIRMIHLAGWASPRRIAAANPRARVSRPGPRAVELALEHGPFYGRGVTDRVASARYAVIGPVMRAMRTRLIGLLRQRG